MKLTKLFIGFTVAMLLVACSKENKVIEFPLVGTANTKMIVIEKVEQTDTATVLTVRGFSYPNTWIKIPSYTHLVAQGMEYKLLDSKDVEIDKELYMPTDGDSCFTLLFEPLPKGSKSFDYIESDARNNWRIHDIDLTGKRDANKPEGLPHELQQTFKAEGDMPEYAYEIGDVTINVHLLGYREGCVRYMVLPVNTTFEGQQQIDVNIHPKTGEGSVTFRQYGTACSYVVINGEGYEYFFTAPGDSIDLYVNLACINTSMRYNYDEGMEIPVIKGCWTKGSRYDELNNLPSVEWNFPDSLNMSNGLFENISADEYTNRVIENYHAICNFIDSYPCHAWKKEIAKKEAFTEGLDRLELDLRRFATQNETTSPSLDVFEPKHYERLYELVDVNSPHLLLAEESYLITKLTQKLDYEKKPGLLFDLYATHNAVATARKYQLSETTIQAFEKGLSKPFFAEVCKDIQHQTTEALAKLNDKIKDVATIAPESLFDHIITPHKGKVILVDFWNTWCGPCRSAIRTNEAYKTGELASEDIVWVYIANETSPSNAYSEMIPNIKGIHYRVNDAQWKYLTNTLFDIDGIPSYVLVEKDGSYSLRNDLRDHTKMVEILKEMTKK